MKSITLLGLLVVIAFAAAFPGTDRPTPFPGAPAEAFKGKNGPPPPQPGGRVPSPAELKALKEFAEKNKDGEKTEEGLEGAESFYHHWGYYPYYSYSYYPRYYYPYYRSYYWW